MAQWSKKEERQYEKVKHSARSRGRSLERAKEIAARTVNKERREKGRTPNRARQGTGNPGRSLEQRSKRQLYNRAKELRIKGRSEMNKGELVRAIRDYS